MIECETTVKRWGNSLGIILPSSALRDNHISAGDKVEVIVTKVGKNNAAKKLWGALHKLKTPSDELERWVDKEFDLP